MTPVPKSRLTVSDVISGVRHAWNTKRADLALSGVVAVALTVATSLSDGGLVLGLTLIGAVLVNLGRIITEGALAIREGRDLDAYLEGVFAARAGSWFDPTGWDGPETQELALADWEKDLLLRPETD